MSDVSRYIVSPHKQGTDGWLADRIGMLTGSRAAPLFAKRGEGDGRARLKRTLALERIENVAAPGPVQTAAMKWGHEQEPAARMLHEGATGLDIQECGFLYLPRLKAGCSVDGLFTDDDGRLGIAEYKCPGRNAHMDALDGGVLPVAHFAQVTHNLWITGAAYCDFQSFDPRLPENLRVFRVRHMRDAAAIDAYERTAMQFLMEVDDLEDQYRRRAA